MSVHYLAGRGYDSNIYLVDGDDPFLVDTGTGANNDEVLRRLKSIVKLERIGRIVLTHRHFDHIGGSSYLRNDTSAQIYIHELDAGPVMSGDGWETQSQMFGVRMEPLDVEVIREKDIFSSGDQEFRVIHTPGHSVGSIALFDSVTGSLISGDTVFVGGVGRWDLPSGSYGDLVDSLGRLLELEPKNLYPGHGPCEEGDARGQILGALRYLGES